MYINLSQRRGTARTLLHYLLFVLFYVLFVCKCILPLGDNPTAVNKYIISSYVRLLEMLFTLQFLKGSALT